MTATRQRPGFTPVPLVPLAVQVQPAQTNVTLTWPAVPGTAYQVEYSTNLLTWFTVPSGDFTATNVIGSWSDPGYPGTAGPPLADAARFYRVLQYGPLPTASLVQAAVP